MIRLARFSSGIAPTSARPAQWYVNTFDGTENMPAPGSSRTSRTSPVPSIAGRSEYVLEREQLDFACVGDPLSEPLGADPLRRNDHSDVGSVGEGPTEFEQHRRLVLESERAGVEQDGLAVVESVTLRPVVRPRHDGHLVERRPVLDHRHTRFVDMPVPECSHEVVADDDHPVARADQELLDLLEHRAHDRSDGTRTTCEVLAHRHAVDVLLPEHDRDTPHQQIRLDDERSNERGVGRDHDIGALASRQADRTGCRSGSRHADAARTSTWRSCDRDRC